MKPSLRKISESVSNFIEKTYEILDEAENDPIISWTPKGHSFLIKDIKLFQNTILPKYFKHSNFSSFVRQLNMYNFHKVRGQKHQNQFEHQIFRKGNRDLLSKIKRKNNELPIVSLTSIDFNQNLHHESPEFSNKDHDLSQEKDEQHGKQNPDNQTLKNLIEQLKEQNNLLKKTKAKQQLQLKSLNSISNAYVAEKFYKLVASLLTQKIKNEVALINRESNNEIDSDIFKGNSNLPLTFDELISHVVEGDVPYNFKEYQECAKLLMKKHTDQFFMLKKNSKRDKENDATE